VRQAKNVTKSDDAFSYYIKGQEKSQRMSLKYKQHKRRESRLHSSRSGSDSHVSSEIESSDEDDKTNPAYWRKDRNYLSLPENVRHAIEVSQLKAKHSDFYYKLKGLNEKISTYKEIFYDRVPKF